MKLTNVETREVVDMNEVFSIVEKIEQLVFAGRLNEINPLITSAVKLMEKTEEILGQMIDLCEAFDPVTAKEYRETLNVSIGLRKKLISQGIATGKYLCELTTQGYLKELHASGERWKH